MLPGLQVINKEVELAVPIIKNPVALATGSYYTGMITCLEFYKTQ